MAWTYLSKVNLYDIKVINLFFEIIFIFNKSFPSYFFVSGLLSQFSKRITLGRIYFRSNRLLLASLCIDFAYFLVRWLHVQVIISSYVNDADFSEATLKGNYRFSLHNPLFSVRFCYFLYSRTKSNRFFLD